ncbi:MAG: ArsC/Spx/MgsR family protein [Aliarcobacter sp.]|nr:ArsC/Spx/MgsR family protein [Aliarcobacter sp.]
MKASQLLRSGEDIYKKLDLENINDEEKLIDIMVLNPILIERPIIIKGDIAVIARPIEKLEELLK